MAQGPGSETGMPLSPAERERLAAIRAADTLSDLVPLTGAETEHDAYFAAKRTWFDLRERDLEPVDSTGGLPGRTVTIDGQAFVVHGITHADSAAERAFLHERVAAFLDAGETVYCEQGIRRMYFADWEGVCAMDDSTWASERRRAVAGDSGSDSAQFEGIAEEVTDLASRVRETAYSLIDSGSEVYGDAFAAALGALASDFLMSHGDVGTAEDFASFALSNRAAEDPSALAELQRYYERAFLPQPLEREWLRRHDPGLEALTHARNERMADYAIYHAGDEPVVHLIVGAAHGPGVRYYLEAHRDGERDLRGFELLA